MIQQFKSPFTVHFCTTSSPPRPNLMYLFNPGRYVRNVFVQDLAGCSTPRNAFTSLIDSAFSFRIAVFFSLQSLCLMHTGKPTGVAVSHCITWFQTQLILTTCQIRYLRLLWDHRRTGQL